ncbi:MAG TPA: hypothetical protein PLH57_07870 [Oligoflexia bacterium]|nr:hypothetical protein [Oligoflexia bacterium]
MKGLFTRTSVIGAVALWSVAGLAASTSTTVSNAPASSGAVSETSIQDVAAQPKALPISAAAVNDFYGPALNDLGARQTADSAKDAVQPLNSRHQIGISYAIDESTKFTPTLDFSLNYTIPKGVENGERNFAWNDSYLKLSRAGLLDGKLGGNAVALDGDIRYMLPTSKGARDADSYGAVRLSLSPSMQIANSNFSIVATNYARIHMYRSVTENLSATRWKFYTGPQVNYAVNDKVTAFVLFEAVAAFDNQGYSNTTNDQLSLADLEPGVELNLHERVSLTPFLNWYTNQPISTTSINLNATIKML